MESMENTYQEKCSGTKFPKSVKNKIVLCIEELLIQIIFPYGLSSVTALKHS